MTKRKADFQITLPTAPAAQGQGTPAEAAEFFVLCDRLLRATVKRQVRIAVAWKTEQFGFQHSGETLISRLQDGRIRAAWRSSRAMARGVTGSAFGISYEPVLKRAMVTRGAWMGAVGVAVSQCDALIRQINDDRRVFGDEPPLLADILSDRIAA